MERQADKCIEGRTNRWDVIHLFQQILLQNVLHPLMFALLLLLPAATVEAVGSPKPTLPETKIQKLSNKM